MLEGLISFILYWCTCQWQKISDNYFSRPIFITPRAIVLGFLNRNRVDIPGYMQYNMVFNESDRHIIYTPERKESLYRDLNSVPNLLMCPSRLHGEILLIFDLMMDCGRFLKATIKKVTGGYAPLPTQNFLGFSPKIFKITAYNLKIVGEEFPIIGYFSRILAYDYTNYRREFSDPRLQFKSYRL